MQFSDRWQRYSCCIHCKKQIASPGDDLLSHRPPIIDDSTKYRPVDEIDNWEEQRISSSSSENVFRAMARWVMLDAEKTEHRNNIWQAIKYARED